MRELDGKPENSLLSVQELCVEFPKRTRKGETTRAVDNVSFELQANETLALAGESGSGKSTLGYTLLGRYKPTSGTVAFAGKDITGVSGRQARSVRRNMQMVFQDPTSTLNPRMKVGEIVAEPLLVHGLVSSGSARRARAIELLEQCGMPRDTVDRYPHMFSGGQRQRIGIARALASSPSVIIADEPTSALDVSIQAQIINLMREIQVKTGVSFLFISHNLAVLRQVSDRIAIMFRGRIVEIGPSEDVFQRPLHPYTQNLLSALPELDPDARWIQRHSEARRDSRFSQSECVLGSSCPMSSKIPGIPQLREFFPSHSAECWHPTDSEATPVSVPQVGSPR